MMRRTGQSNVFSLLSILGVALAGCNATSTPVARKPSATIEIQETVGFTITEEVEATDNDHADYAMAIQVLENGELDRGIAELERIVLQVPNATAAHIDLGIAYHRTGDLEAAEKHLRTALDVNPAHPVALNELGVILRETGRFAEARRHYEAAIDVYPGYHHARRNLAILCDLYLADQGCALDHYQAYLRSVPSDPEVEMWVTDLKMRSGQE